MTTDKVQGHTPGQMVRAGWDRNDLDQDVFRVIIQYAACPNELSLSSVMKGTPVYIIDDAALSQRDALRQALENLLTYDRVMRPAFRSKPLGAPNSQVRIDEDKLIACEDAALSALAAVRESEKGEK
jgi:hypothetical protein